MGRRSATAPWILRGPTLLRADGGAVGPAASFRWPSRRSVLMGVAVANDPPLLNGGRNNPRACLGMRKLGCTHDQVDLQPVQNSDGLADIKRAFDTLPEGG